MMIEKRIKEILEDLQYILAADIQEVVRCKDCKYYKIMENCFRKDGTPIHYCNSDMGCSSVLKDDDFCSFGERKDDNEN